MGDDGEEEEEATEKDDNSGPDYNYLLSMPMWFLTKEKKEELCKQRDAKVRKALTLRFTFKNLNQSVLGVFSLQFLF